jgi:biopolymer transport protein ExbD
MMAFQSTELDDEDGVMSEINMTPLVDVMLVLLIIFIITVPVINHAVKLDLPQAISAPNDTRPTHVTLSIDAGGQVFWDAQPVSADALPARLGAAAQQSPQPEFHLHADSQTAYQHVAKFLAAAHQAGLAKVAFATDPNPR